MVKQEITRNGPPFSQQSEAWEKELLHRTQLGERAALGELLRSYQDRVFSLVRRLVGHDAQAEELTQEAFLQAFKSISRYDKERPFRPWLFKIAVNVCRNFLRSTARRELPQNLGSDVPALWQSQLPDPEQEALREHTIDLVDHLLASLSPEDRSLVLLRCHEGMSYRELHSVFRRSETVLRKRVQRALERLQALADGVLQ